MDKSLTFYHLLATYHHELHFVHVLLMEGGQDSEHSERVLLAVVVELKHNIEAVPIQQLNVEGCIAVDQIATQYPVILSLVKYLIISNKHSTLASCGHA